jgi:hypothetical protein
MKIVGLFSCLASALFLSACGSVDAGDVCARAAAHVTACGAAAPASSASCDRDAAAQLLTLDCAQLAAAVGTRRIDSVGSTLDGVACAAGIVRLCPEPACTAPAYPGPSTTCRDYIGIAGCGGCQFYACREAEHACGATGYYLGFADKYCTRFLQSLRPRLSPDGQRFLDVARDCLMRFVDEQLPSDDACNDVYTRAFNSHVACYHDNGFCKLSLEDRWLIFNTVDPADFNLSAALKTALSCL